MANVGLQPAEQVAGELRDILAGIVSGEVQWSVFAQRFADALPGSGLALFMIDTRDPHNNIAQAAELPQERIDAYLDYYGTLNPWTPLIRQTPAGTVLATEVHSPVHLIHNSEFYNDWLRTLGDVEASTGIKLIDKNDRFAQITSQYPLSRNDIYLPYAMALLAEIRAPLMEALDLACRLNRSSIAAVARGSIAERLSDAAFVVDLHQRLLEANGAARAMINDGTVVRLRGDRLILSDRSADNWMVSVLHSTPGGPHRQGNAPACTDSHICVTPDGPAVRLRMSRLNLPLMFPLVRSDTPHLLLIRPLEQFEIDAQRLDQLAALYRLTPAEQALCADMMTGQSLNNISDLRGARIATLRDRLKAVFAKTGTSRQSELIALLMRATL